MSGTFVACLMATIGMANPLRYAEDRAPAIVNPLFATTMSEARIDELVFEGLFADDLELKSAGRLAESFELSADLMSMKIRLRRDVVWHDGEPFDADDVVFTISAYKDPSTASSEAGRVTWVKEAIAMDPYTVFLTFTDPEYAPQDKLHFKILPTHRFGGTPVKRTHNFRTQPVGTGPFKVVSFNEDNSITLARHERYWNAAKVDEVVMREVSDKNYQAKLLTFESLETLIRVLPRDLATLQNDRKVELYPYQTNSWWYLGYNLRRKSLRSEKVRRAIASMINVDDLLAPIGTGDRVSGPFVRSSPFYNHDIAPMSHDPDRGAELLNDAGYTFDGSSWVDNKGKQLTFKLVTLRNLETAMDVVINIQSQLQSKGVAVEPEFLGVAEYRQRVWRNNDFDMILSQWSFDRSEDIYEQFHSSGSRNFIGYANPEVDRMLVAARDAVDPQKKKAVLRDVHRIVATDQPMVFLWTLDSYAALSTKVKGVTVHPFYFFTWASDWALQK
ncbi:MAG: hypothetical protein KTR31_00710 [Myxococcales bacterium]|nr:hypothetical protein [Myxococcales bacterium]